MTLVLNTMGGVEVQQQRRNIRICEVTTDDRPPTTVESDVDIDSSVWSCDISHRPRGLPLTFILLTQCASDHPRSRSDAGNDANSSSANVGEMEPMCAPAALSSSLLVTLPSLLSSHTPLASPSDVVDRRLHTASSSAAVRLQQHEPIVFETEVSGRSVDSLEATRDRSTTRTRSNITTSTYAVRMHSLQSSLVGIQSEIDRVVNDTMIREDLAIFFNFTNGPQWADRTNWLNSTVSLCDWIGIGCNDNRTAIVSFDFTDFNLNVDAAISVDISVLVRHISSLLALSIASNVALCLTVPVDLSSQLGLVLLDVTHAGEQCAGINPILLPAVSRLRTIAGSYSNLQFTNRTIAFPQLQTLDIRYNRAPFALATFMTMTNLIELSAVDAVIETSTPDAAGRIGGELTHAWLAGLDQYNPHVEQIDLSYASHLTFDRVPGEKSNWPVIASATLRELMLSYMTQLRSDPSGVPLDWLIPLPSLVKLAVENVPSVVVDLHSFDFASTTTLASVGFTGSVVIGDISALVRFPITDLALAGIGVRGSLPANISAVWPGLTTFKIAAYRTQITSLTGSVPSFAHLPNLTTLQLDSYFLSGQLPSDFLVGSLDELLTLEISSPLLAGPLPAFDIDVSPLTFLDLEGQFTGGLAPTFTRTAFPVLQTLDLQKNALNGTIPPNFWDQLPQLQYLQLTQNLFTGTIPSPSTLRSFEQLGFSKNPFVGSLPGNLRAGVYDLSFTHLSGPVIMLDDTLGEFPTTVLNLAFSGLGCPLNLSSLLSLRYLDLHSAGFGGCDFTDPTQFLLPVTSTFTEIDVRLRD
jgi:hypothetical protein